MPGREAVVNCYDCAVEGRTEAALGRCRNCGTGVCQQHLDMGQHAVDQSSVGPRAAEASRRLLCTSCDHVLAEPEGWLTSDDVPQS